MKNQRRKNYFLWILAVLVLLRITPVAQVYAKEELKLNETKISLYVGNDFELEIAEGYESESSDEDSWWWWWYSPSYTSSDVHVAVVDSNGIIHAVGPGKATIEVYYNGATASCEVEVKKNSCVISEDTVHMYINDQIELSIKHPKKKAESYSYRVYDPVSMERIYSGYRIKALKNGTFSITMTQKGSYLVELILNAQGGKSYSAFCNFEVEWVGLTATRATLAMGTTYRVEIVNATDVTYSIQKEEGVEPVAKVTSKGTIKPLKTGETYLLVSYTDPHGNRIEDVYMDVCVTDPVLVPLTKSIWIDDWYAPEFTGIDYTSIVTISSSNEEVVMPGSYGECRAVGAGTATLTYLVDGKEFTEEVRVINPRLSKNYAVLKKKETLSLKVTGADENCKIKYKSFDKSVASVTQKGKITAKKNGTALITVTVDGREFYCTVTVMSSKGYLAVKAGEKVLGAAYSQEKRMQKGYYDCSSFVWRMYDDAGYKLFADINYAPTAADLAKRLEKNGKAIAYEYVSPSELKPGDLIFYAGNNNGRYKNINHVAMFYGHYLATSYFWGDDYGELIDYGLVIHASGDVHIKEYEGYRNGQIVMIARPYGK